MRIAYGLSRDGWRDFRSQLKGLVVEEGARQIGEIGGGANPALPFRLVRRFQVDYTVFDVSAEELIKAPIGYQTAILDGTAVPEHLFGQFDLILSRMTAEHIPDAHAFHAGIFHMLRPGGKALHFFPTLHATPFVLNRFAPERMTERLLSWIQPHRNAAGAHGKFPAYYRWCRGPSRTQQKRFESLGYRVLEYKGYFGHSGTVTDGPGYWDRFPPLCRMHEWMSRRLMSLPNPLLTSYACVLLEKPSELVVEAVVSKRREFQLSLH